VVTDQRRPRDGAHLEVIGHYDPLANPAALTVKEERAVHWLKAGAKPSDAAAKILTKAGVMEQAGIEAFVYVGKQMPKGSKNPRKGKDEEEAAAPAAAAAAAPAAAAPAAEAAAEAPAEEAPAEEPAGEEAAAEEPAPAAEETKEEPAAEEAAPAEDTESS
jgi:small subunit ribosomal protein S16